LLILCILEKGGKPLYLARAEKLLIRRRQGSRAAGVWRSGRTLRRSRPGARSRSEARHYVLAGGGINSPALLLALGRAGPASTPQQYVN